MIIDYFLTETPFKYRHVCWFCGEPKQFLFGFPHDQWLVFHCIHSALKVPTCRECYGFALNAKVDSIWQVQTYVKQQLIKRYKKDLAVGLNWTQEELENSDFEGGSFEGFQRSAWFMYEVAKGRVNYAGWPLIVEGIVLSYEEDKVSFLFDGMYYPTIDDAIGHYIQTFGLNSDFFRKIIAELGERKFGEAVRYARVFIGSTPQEQSKALNQLKSR